MSWREGRMVVVVGMLLSFGYMLCWSCASTPAGGVWWPTAPLSTSPPWRRLRERSGLVGSSPNKPEGRTDLEMSSLLPWISPCCRGGGRGRAEELGSRLRRPDKVTRPWRLFSVTIEVLWRWRSQEFPSILGGITPADRWPAVAALQSPTLLIEWRSSSSSRSEYQKGGSRGLARHPLPRRLLRWRGGGELITPSGVVPGGDEFGSRLELVCRTGLQSRIGIWCPLCKVLGLGCNFYPLLGPPACCTACYYI
jgi:hypothetical protein